MNKLDDRIRQWNDNNTEIGFSGSLGDWFHESALTYPNRIAAQDPWGTMDYRTLEETSNAVANALLAREDCPKDSYISILIGARRERLIYLTGVIKAGMAYVPMDEHAPLARNATILKNVSGHIILTDEEHREAARAILRTNGLPEDNALVMLPEELATMDTHYPSVAKNPHSDSAVFHTSGSTGTPKGIRVADGGLVNFYWTLMHEFCGFSEKDRICTILNFAFDFSSIDMFSAMLSGARLVFPPEEIRTDIEALHAFIQENGITILSLPTALFHIFVEWDNPVLQKVIVGGESLTKYRKRHYDIYNIYGPTETTIFCSFHKVEEESANIPIGKPLGNYKILILKEDGSFAGVGEWGEICIHSPNVTNGYINNEEETNRVFVPSVLDPNQLMYRTGDIGEWTDEGYLLHHGRLDYQIKYRGYRIEPDEINQHISRLNGIRESCVVFFNESDRQFLACFYATEKDASVDGKTCEAQLAKTLPEYMIPTHWRQIPEIPKNSHGKTDRKALQELLRQELAATPSMDAPPLKQLWANLLGIPADFDEDKTFNELGGHSIMVLMLLFRVKELEGVTISFREFMAHDSYTDFAAFLEKKRESGDEEPGAYRDDFEHQEDPFPLHVMQQAYYVGRQPGVELGQIPTHMYLELSLTPFDYDRFLSTVNKMLGYHDALRLRIYDDATQQILPYYEATAADVPCLDLREIAPEDFPQKLQELRDEWEQQVVRYSEESLLKVRLLRTEENAGLVQLYLDGFVCDGWSQEILIRDFDYLYRDESHTLPKEKHLYRDYVNYTLRDKEEPEYLDSKAYWLDKLPTLPDVPELPLKTDPGEIEEIHIGHLVEGLSRDEWDAFKAHCAKRGLTTPNAMITVFAKVMAKWSRKKDFIINLPLANRFFDEVNFEDTFGLMSDFMIFDVHDMSGETFAQTARRHQQQLRDLSEHRAFCGIEVIRELSKLKGDLGNSAPVVFTSLVEVPEYELTALKPKMFKTHTSQVWIDVVALRCDDQIQFSWDYVEELFEEETIQGLFDTFMHELRGLCSDESFWDAMELTVISPLTGSIETAKGPAKEREYRPMVHLLEEAAKTHETEIAVITSLQSYTYSELYEDVKKTAAYFMDQGIRPGDVLAILMDKRYEQIVCVLAALYSGAVYLPLDTQNSVQRIEHCLQEAEAKLLLTEQRMQEQYPGIAEAIPVISVDEAAWNGTTALPYAMPNLSPDDLYAILYTSGSTGTPKGVMLGQMALQNCIVFTNDLWNVRPEDRILSLTNLCHDMSLYDIFGMLTAGAALVLPDEERVKDPTHWAQLIEKNRVSLWNSVPPMMEMLLETLDHESAGDIHSLRAAIMGGDRMVTTLPGRLWYYTPGLELYNVGGPTEATIWSIYHKVTPEDTDRIRIPLGKAIDNVNYMVFNESLELCPYDVVGTIFTEGINLSKGYLKAPEKTEEKFIRNPYTGNIMYDTGDLGKYDKNGDIDILGRADNQIKINGKRIELGEIEAVALHSDAIESAACNFDPTAKKIILYYKKEKEIARDELKELMERELPDFMVPAAYVEIDKMPLSANGKVDRRQLPEYTWQTETTSEAESPENMTAQVLAIYREVIQSPDLSPEDNFFAAGGDSLKAIKLVYALNDAFGTDVQLMEMFMYPTVAQMAENIKSK